MIYVVATLTVHPEHKGDFLENARTVIAATHKEKGCQSYDLFSSITEPNQFVFVERWESREALSAHFETPHLVEWRRLCEEYVVSRIVEIIAPQNVEVL